MMEESEQEDPRFDERPSVLQKLQKWADYEAYGGCVSPTNFLPMKTPLASEILLNWNLEEPPRYPLSVSHLLQGQQAEGRRVGMIIDLSNHETLYGADLAEHDIQYERVPLVAKVFPTQRAVNKVIEVADRFWSEHPELCIAIHCAYGFNRTGFVVCSYLVQACNLSLQDALDNFAAARPPGIRHEQFVAELHKRYDSFRSERPSLSDLRGYASKSGVDHVGSLTSDFVNVAEHFHEHHPGLIDRSGGLLGGSSVQGNSDSASAPESPVHPSRVPSLRARSLHAATEGSNCESVNNESLDLDEREIYRQFANRQLKGPLPAAEAANGHHRRKAQGAALPVVQASEGSSPSSRSSYSTRPSPFANAAQNGADIFSKSLRSEALMDSSISGAGEASAPASRSANEEGGLGFPADLEHQTTQNRSPSRLRGPISERVFTQVSSEVAGCEDSSLKQQGRSSRRNWLPCTIM